MTKTVKKLIQENNEKRKLLSEDNEQYYSNFITYVRAAYLKDERATEEVLLEMLDHLLLAQEDHRTAQQFFGKEPKLMADEVIENLPNESFKEVFIFGVELLATVIAYYTLITGVFDIFTKKDKIIYVGNSIVIIAILGITLAAIIYTTLLMIQKESFNQKKSKRYYLYIFAVFFIGSVLTAYSSKELAPIGRAIELGHYGMFSIGCLLLLLTYIMKKIREQK